MGIPRASPPVSGALENILFGIPNPSFSPIAVYSNHVDASLALTLLSVLFIILLTS